MINYFVLLFFINKKGFLILRNVKYVVDMLMNKCIIVI